MKKSKTDRREELRGLMHQEVEKNLITDDELSRVAGGTAAAEATQEVSCECWCSTGLLSTCQSGTVAV
jgi:hypothetical protein